MAISVLKKYQLLAKHIENMRIQNPRKRECISVSEIKCKKWLQNYDIIHEFQDSSFET